MLQSVRTIPYTCSQRITELNQTAWAQLDNNQVITVASRPDILTVLCSKYEPSDFTLITTGKFKLNNMYKGYAPKIIMQV
jgi:hypothetical protein